MTEFSLTRRGALLGSAVVVVGGVAGYLVTRGSAAVRTTKAAAANAYGPATGGAGASGGHLLAKLILGQDENLDLDVGVRTLKLGHELLQVFHLRVSHRRHGDRRLTRAVAASSAAKQSRGGTASNPACGSWMIWAAVAAYQVPAAPRSGRHYCCCTRVT